MVNNKKLNNQINDLNFDDNTNSSIEPKYIDYDDIEDHSISSPNINIP